MHQFHTVPTQRGEETRQQMMDIIRHHPGVNKLELQKAVGLGWGTIVYNVDILVSRGRVQTFRDRGHVRLFDAGLPPEDVPYFCALRSKHSDRVIARMRDEGRVQAYEVADDLGVSRKVIRRTLENMQRHGLLERAGRARKHYSFTEAATQFLHRWNGSEARATASRPPMATIRARS